MQKNLKTYLVVGILALGLVFTVGQMAYARITNPSASVTTPISVANGGTGLTTFGGTNTVLYSTAADTLSSESAFAYSASLDRLTFVNGSTTALTIATDLYIPTATDPTISTTGDLALNTTAASTSLRVHDGTAERVANLILSKSAVMASSTLAYMGSYGAAGTTTVQLWNPPRPITVLAVTCRTDTGTGKMNLNDGTNLATMVPCSTTGARTTMDTNNTWVMSEDFKLSVGTIASAPNTFTVTVEYREDAD